MQFHQICGRQVPACEDEVPELIINWAIQHVPEPLLHSGLTWTFLACRYAVPLVETHLCAFQLADLSHT